VWFGGEFVCAAHVSRPTSDTIGTEAIAAAIAKGFSVECEGLLYGDPSRPRASADSPRLLLEREQERE